jgi:hypothetical protein
VAQAVDEAPVVILKAIAEVPADELPRPDPRALIARIKAMQNRGAA